MLFQSLAPDMTVIFSYEMRDEFAVQFHIFLQALTLSFQMFSVKGITSCGKTLQFKAVVQKLVIINIWPTIRGDKLTS